MQVVLFTGMAQYGSLTLKNKNMKIIVYLISDMEAKLSRTNIETINALTELNFEDTLNVTYQMLIDARKLSRGSEYGFPKYTAGVLTYVLPCIPMGLVVDPLSTVIKEVTKEDYVTNYLPTFDIEEDEL